MQYESEDIDPYYCAACNEQRKEIAKEIDAKLALRPKKPVMTAMQQYDASPKVRGYILTKLN